MIFLRKMIFKKNIGAPGLYPIKIVLNCVFSHDFVSLRKDINILEKILTVACLIPGLCGAMGTGDTTGGR